MMGGLKFSNVSNTLKELCYELSLLYIECDEEIKKMVSENISQYFRDFIVVSNEKKTLEALRTKRYDIIITSLNIPDISNCELIAKAKKHCSKQKVIVLSSNLDPLQTIRLINIGIDGYILKPLQIDMLLSLLVDVASKIHEDKLLMHYLEQLENQHVELQNRLKPAIDSILSYQLNNKASKSEAVNTFFDDDEDFFDLDSFDAEETGMDHLNNYEKISARELFDKGYFDQETAQDIIDSSDIMLEIHYQEGLTLNYLTEASKRIGSLALHLKASGEFVNLSFTLCEMEVLLKNLISSHDFSNSELNQIYKQFIDSIILDIVTWTKEVMVYKSTIDVHYLDASLLSSVSTFNSIVHTN